MPDVPPKVFISYAHEDAVDFARRLSSDLQNAGYHTWLDSNDIKGGNRLDERIEDGIQSACLIAYVMTPHSIRSESVCRDEIAYALKLGKHVVPLKMQADIVPPLNVVRFRLIDFFGGYHAGFTEFLKTVRPIATALGFLNDAQQPEKVKTVDAAERIYVRAGKFTMGADDGRPDEKPKRTVYLDAYYIQKNLVTVAQYETFCTATRRDMPNAPLWGWTDKDYPMANVSWDDVQAYAVWTGGSLPTEAQWEKAARGTDGRMYPWGNEWDPLKCHNGSHHPAPIGSFPSGVSPYGVLDMAGNIGEWCHDWYGNDSYYTSPNSNPHGPHIGGYRVVRGGGWGGYGAGYFRCASRGMYLPVFRYSIVGFRCVFRVDS